jgi:predicted amidohydrolase
MSTMRVTGVQMTVSPKLEENLPKVLGHIQKHECDFILFPEMSLTGYHGGFSGKAAAKAWDQIAEACRQSYTTAFIGTGCKIDGDNYIQTRIFNGEGELVGTHEKIVPTSGDREFCRPGDELRTFRQNGFVYGCLICNDLWVTPGCGPYPDPRLAYQLGIKGAQVIFHAINSGANALHVPYHESNVQSRAMESKLHIVTANAAVEGGAVNCRSGIMSPEGEWLASVPREGEHTFTYDLELESD